VWKKCREEDNYHPVIYEQLLEVNIFLLVQTKTITGFEVMMLHFCHLVTELLLSLLFQKDITKE